MQIVEAPTGEKCERNCGNLKLYLPYAERFRFALPPHFFLLLLSRSSFASTRFYLFLRGFFFFNRYFASSV